MHLRSAPLATLCSIALLSILSACSAKPSPDVPVFSDVQSSSSSWSSSFSSSASTEMSSAQSSVTASHTNEVMGEHEATPQGIESLEVPTTATGKTMTGTVLVNSVVYGTTPCLPAQACTVPTMIEYFDYDCEYCRLHLRTHRPWIVATYVATGTMNIERVFVPMTPAGIMMAEAALCAGYQQKFTAMDEWLLKNLPKTQDVITKSLKAMTIEPKQFAECMRRKDVFQDSGKLTDGSSIKRVPAFAIGTTRWEGVLDRDSLKQTIEEALAGK